MSRIIFVTAAAILVLCNMVLGHHLVKYTDLEVLGVSCPRRDSCRNINSNFTDRNCECSRDCAFFKDCCIDSPNAITSRRTLTNTRLTCMQYGHSFMQGEYVVGTCPMSYDGPESVLEMCHGGGDQLDPVLSAPVTDTVTRITYLNRYCAECNDALSPYLETWIIYMDCGRLNDLDISDDFKWDQLSYMPSIDKWGVRVGRQFHKCNMVYDKPESIRYTFRNCRPNLISSCPSDWNSPLVEKNCEGYTSVMYSKSLDSTEVYKNVHCAICNGVAVSDVTCDPTGLMGRRMKQFSFAMLLDVNRSDGDKVGVSTSNSTVTCPANQKYDPFFKKCRALVCALPGYKLVKGKCTKQK